MALRQGSIKGRASKKEEIFRTHLAVYLCVGLFLLTLNLLTSPFDLWFYWPLFFWGWGLVFHALATYGADAPARVPEVLRSLVPWIGDSRPASQSNREIVVQTPPFAAEAFAAVHERIERLKALSWRLPDGPVRQQAEHLSAQAERIVAAMAHDRADAVTVNRFDTELLAPTASLLDGFARAADSGVLGNDSLRRIEEHDLPALQTRFDAQSEHWLREASPASAVAAETPDADPLAPTRVPLQSHP